MLILIYHLAVLYPVSIQIPRGAMDAVFLKNLIVEKNVGSFRRSLSSLDLPCLRI